MVGVNSVGWRSVSVALGRSVVGGVRVGVSEGCCRVCFVPGNLDLPLRLSLAAEERDHTDMRAVNPIGGDVQLQVQVRRSRFGGTE